MTDNGLKFSETRFVKVFFPLKVKTTMIAFEPFRLVNSTKLKKYLEDRKIFTEEQRTILDHIIGDGGTVLFENEQLIDIFTRNGLATVHISETGKDINPKTFYWVPYTYSKEIDPTAFLNFFYHEKGSFYGLRANGFSNQIKASCYDRDTKELDVESSTELYQELNEEDSYESAGFDVLNDLTFKSSKVTLAKILISLLPEIGMRHIVELSDFVKSEMLSKKSASEISENIFELKGELITFFYNSKNYLYPQEGTLGGSCMKNDGNTEQIRFYANNPTNVSLLTYIENKKLLARAVLWKDVRGFYCVDRIYCSSTKYGTLLAAYCKSNEMRTIHHCTGTDYGIPHTHDCVVALDDFELKNSVYPYLDSIGFIDVVNKYISPVMECLRDYLDSKSKDYIIKSINRGGAIGSRYCGETIYFRKSETRKLKYLKTREGKEICDQLSQYALVRKPVLSLIPKANVVTINSQERVDSSWCSDTLIRKYNSIRPTLLFTKSDGPKAKYTVRLYDKQFLVYSTYHRFYIRKIDSEYIPFLKTYVIKFIVSSKEFQCHLHTMKLRKLYGGKLVRITNDGIQEIKDQISLLPFKESLMDIRKSRVYNISVRNILDDGVKIKGIIVPYKHLRFVRK